jgi:glycosyltransferase involved in cell wall biosynthesis
MRILTISTLYPNNEDPKHGIFVENRLRNLVSDFSDVEASVIAPVPWFPIKSERFPEYSKYVDVKKQEQRFNLSVQHPRFIVVPKVGMLLTPYFMAFSLYFAIKKNIKEFGRPDVIDSHYFFPDGVAVRIVSKLLNIPFTCTSRGTDINLIADMPRPRKMIQKVINQAQKCMAVCQALSDKLSELGANKPATLRNGVDLSFFHQVNEEERLVLKNELVFKSEGSSLEQKKILLSVGWLVERKGHYLIIEAMNNLPDYLLLIAGNGPDEMKLKQLVTDHHLGSRVIFLGSLSQAELKRYYQLADALVLASSREGWANVLLESMACGTPVVATNIWGTPEVVQTDTAGLLCERTVDSIANTVEALFTHYPNRNATREYAEQFDWRSTSKGQYDIFSEIIEKNRLGS